MASSKNQSGFVDSWQNGKTLAQCNLHMLETGDFCDVIFLVGSDGHVIKAHRYVLVSRSCVFHDLFCGQREQGSTEITIPDIDPAIFKDFLRFVYSETVTITFDNCAGLQYTARKFNVQALFEETISFLEKSLCEENVAELLEQSHFHDGLDLGSKALIMLKKAGPEMVKSPGFLDLCSACFGKFLQSKTLNLSEEEVFEATLIWTKERCKRRNLTSSHANMRNILGEMLYDLRFVSMSSEFLVTTVGPSGILTSEERHAVMDRKFDKSIDIKPFKSGRRNNEPFFVERFKKYGRDGWNMDDVHAITFSPSREVSLLGCRPFADEDSGEAEMTLYDDHDNRVAGPVNCSLTGREKFLFPDPILLHAGRFYAICVDVDEHSEVDHVGIEGEGSVCFEEVTFTFRDSPKSMTETCVRYGLIVALICQHAD